MRWDLIRAARDVEGLAPAAKFVLVMLALRAGDDGRAWPSLARIVADTGYGRSTVSVALTELAEAGHLEVIHRPGHANMVTLTHPESGRVTHPESGPTHPESGRTHPESGPRSKPRRDTRSTTTGSTTPWPVVAGNGNTNGTAAVIHNGPAPGESWGEYRERGGR